MTIDSEPLDSGQRNYYCSMKFRYLKIDLESGTTYNCHAAKSRPIDFKWLENNRGNLFNTPTSIAEREMMLVNQRNDGCEQNCWRAEDIGAISPRIYQGGIEQTHTQVITHPEIIDLTVGSDCNLTCAYCSKEYSSSWRRDILENGDYHVESDDRYQANNKDRVLYKISQPQLKTHNRYVMAFEEIKLAAPHLKTLIVTGGEPLLDNQIVDMIASLEMSEDSAIEVYTGLGVSESRFHRMLEKFRHLKNLKFIVSAECTGKYLEFNRYGVRWPEFAKKIAHLKEFNINTMFHATLTNLTLFGFSEFCKMFGDYDMNVTFAYKPEMMAPNILDNESKQYIIDSLVDIPEHHKNNIVASIVAEPMDKQREDLRIFLSEFVRRRPDLDLRIYPNNFLRWLGLENHVV